jgi:hypothetical protein
VQGVVAPSARMIMNCRPEESPIAWFGELLIAIDGGDFDRASESQRQLDRLGWRVVTRKGSRPTPCQAARFERAKHDSSPWTKRLAL